MSYKFPWHQQEPPEVVRSNFHPSTRNCTCTENPDAHMNEYSSSLIMLCYTSSRLRNTLRVNPVSSDRIPPRLKGVLGSRNCSTSLDCSYAVHDVHESRYGRTRIRRSGIRSPTAHAEIPSAVHRMPTALSHSHNISTRPCSWVPF
jgi:hypothetical protein